jgi:hypothetical protein
MTGTIRKATILVAFGLLAASTAMAGIPNPANCTWGEWINVVGNLDGTPDPIGAYTVVVHDVYDLPILGSTVTINFAGASDLRLCTDVAPEGQTNTCNVATAITNSSGEATFIVCGGAMTQGGLLTGGAIGAVEVRADGYYLGVISACAYDLNGALTGGGGVTGADDAAWQGDMGLFGGAENPDYKCRNDYTQNGEQTGADRSAWQSLMGLGTSAFGCTYCP